MKLARLWFLALLGLLLVPDPGAAGQRSPKHAKRAKAQPTSATAPAAPVTASVASATPTAPTPIAAPAPGAASMRVAIDPETGLPVSPTAEQNRALDAESAPRRPLPPLTMVRLPDGTLMVRLDDRFLQHSVAVLDANGAIQTRCVHDAASAERMVGASPGAPASGIDRCDDPGLHRSAGRTPSKLAPAPTRAAAPRE